MKHLFLIAVLCPLFTLAQWSRVDGFDNGRINGLESAGQYLVATSGGGIFRTANPQNGWVQVSDGDESEHFQGLKRFGNALFARGFFGSQCHRSTNQGESWEALLVDGDFITDIAVLGSYYIAQGGSIYSVYISDDEGATWSTPEGLDVSEKLMADESFLYSFSYAISRSNGSEPFVEIESPNFFDVFLSGGVLFGYTNDGLYASNDHGDSWQLIDSHPNLAQGGLQIHDIEVLGNTWYLSMQYPVSGVLVSEDAGESFDFFPTELIDQLELLCAHNGQLFGNRLYESVVQLAFAEEDLTLAGVSNGISSPNIIDVLPGGQDMLIVELFENVAGSVDGQSNFTEYTNFPQAHTATDAPTLPRYCSEGAMVFYRGGSPAAYFRPHGASQFTDITGNLFSDGLILSYDQIRNAMVEGQHIVLQKSGGMLLVSHDFGATWTSEASNLFSGIAPLVLLNGEIYGVGSNAYDLVKSSDWGQSAETVVANPMGDVIRFVLKSGNHLIISTAEQRAISEDFGETWSIYENEQFATAFEALRNTEGGLLMYGYSTEPGDNVFYSNDFGLSFAAIDEGGLPNRMPAASRIYQTDGMLFLRVDAGNLYRATPQSIGVVLSTNDHHEPVKALNSFPNPAHERLFFEAMDVPSQFQAWSLDGRLIVDQVLSPGLGSVDVSAWPAGCYLVQLRAVNGSGIFSDRVVIQR